MAHANIPDPIPSERRWREGMSWFAKFERAPREKLAELVEELRASSGQRFCTDRLFEWVAATTMIFISMTLALPGETLERSALSPLLFHGVTEEGLASFFGICGTLRGVALFANGRLRPSGARMRAFGAIAGALVWVQLAVVLFFDSLISGKPSFLLPIFIGLVGGEMVSCYRAVFDAGKRHAGLGSV